MTLFDFSELLPSADEFIKKVFPGGWAPVITQLLATAIIVVIFFVFLFKPVRKILSARASHIAENIENAELVSKDANILLDEATKRISTSKVEANKIIEKSKIDAETISSTIVEETKQQCVQMKVNCQREIELETKKAADDIEKSIIDIALSASSKILEREITAKDNKKLVEDFIEEMRQ